MNYTFAKQAFTYPLQMMQYTMQLPLPHHNTTYVKKHIQFIQIAQLEKINVQSIISNNDVKKLQKAVGNACKKKINQQWFENQSQKNKLKLIQMMQYAIKYIKYSKQQRSVAISELIKANEAHEKQLKLRRKNIQKKKNRLMALKDEHHIKKQSLRQYRVFLQTLPHCKICKITYKNIKIHDLKYHQPQKEKIIQNKTKVVQSKKSNTSQELSVIMMQKMLNKNEQLIKFLLENPKKKDSYNQQKQLQYLMIKDMRQEIINLKSKINLIQNIKNNKKNQNQIYQNNNYMDLSKPPTINSSKIQYIYMNPKIQYLEDQKLNSKYSSISEVNQINKISANQKKQNKLVSLKNNKKIEQMYGSNSKISQFKNRLVKDDEQKQNADFEIQQMNMQSKVQQKKITNITKIQNRNLKMNIVDSQIIRSKGFKKNIPKAKIKQEQQHQQENQTFFQIKSLKQNSKKIIRHKQQKSIQNLYQIKQYNNSQNIFHNQTKKQENQQLNYSEDFQKQSQTFKNQQTQRYFMTQDIPQISKYSKQPKSIQKESQNQNDISALLNQSHSQEDQLIHKLANISQSSSNKRGRTSISKYLHQKYQPTDTIENQNFGIKFKEIDNNLLVSKQQESVQKKNNSDKNQQKNTKQSSRYYENKINEQDQIESNYRFPDIDDQLKTKIINKKNRSINQSVPTNQTQSQKNQYKRAQTSNTFKQISSQQQSIVQVDQQCDYIQSIVHRSDQKQKIKRINNWKLQEQYQNIVKIYNQKFEKSGKLLDKQLKQLYRYLQDQHKNFLGKDYERSKNDTKKIIVQDIESINNHIKIQSQKLNKIIKKNKQLQNQKQKHQLNSLQISHSQAQQFLNKKQEDQNIKETSNHLKKYDGFKNQTKYSTKLKSYQKNELNYVDLDDPLQMIDSVEYKNDFQQSDSQF